MTENDTNNSRFLLDDLNDPFVLMPLRSLSNSISALIENNEDQFQEMEGPQGRSRRFWDVPMELLHDEIGLYIGSVFVLGQASITQTVSIVSQLHVSSGNNSAVPKAKNNIRVLPSS